MRTLCVWCRREGRDPESADTPGFPGLCEEHIRRFTAEVEAALQVPAGTTADVPSKRPRRAPKRLSEKLVEQVAEILVRNARTDLCDGCIAGELRCTVAEVQEATARLAASTDFLRDQWRCGRCGGRQLVTRARSRLFRSRSA